MHTRVYSLEMECVVKGLLNVFRGVEPPSQWNRAVGALAKMNHLEVSQTWLAFVATMPKDEKESSNHATLMCFKMLFKQALLSAESESSSKYEYDEILQCLREALHMCSEYKEALRELAVVRATFLNEAGGNQQVYTIPTHPLRDYANASISNSPEIASIGHAPAATTAPPPAASPALAAQLQASTADVRLALRALDERVQADNKKLIEKVAAQEADVNEVKAKLAKLGPKIKAIEAINVEQEQRAYDSLNDKVAVNEADARTLKTKLERLETTVDGLKANDLQQQMADLKGKITNRETIELATKDLVANVQTQVADLAKRVTAAATAPSAAGVDETKLENKIAENVRIGLIADAKAKLDTLQKENAATLTAAIDAMKQETTVAVETVKKDATVAIAETKTETAAALGELAQWRVDEEARIADGTDKVGILLNEAQLISEQSAWENQVWNIARREIGMKSVDALQIQGAVKRLDTDGNNRELRDAMSAAKREKWAHSRDSHATPFDVSKLPAELQKSPYAQPAGPSPARRLSMSPPRAALSKGAAPGSARPASHTTTGTRSMFSSIFGESPYVFADD